MVEFSKLSGGSNRPIKTLLNGPFEHYRFICLVKYCFDCIAGHREAEPSGLQFLQCPVLSAKFHVRRSVRVGYRRTGVVEDSALGQAGDGERYIVWVKLVLL